MHSMSNEDVYRMVARIPKGKVATYGQIARLIGYPRHSRHIGRALAQLTGAHQIPWQRVINAKGKISSRGMDGCDDFQRILLEEEGIIFINDTVSLKIFQWEC